MRHRRSGRKLGRDASHRKALYANLASALIEHGRIKTTEAKAKEVRPIVEELITLARRSDVAEEMRDDVGRAQLRERPAAGGEVAALAERDHLLGERLDGLCLRLRRLDPAVLEQRAREVRVERLAVRGVAPQLLACAGVPHATRLLAG